MCSGDNPLDLITATAIYEGTYEDTAKGENKARQAYCRRIITEGVK